MSAGQIAFTSHKHEGVAKPPPGHPHEGVQVVVSAAIKGNTHANTQLLCLQILKGFGMKKILKVLAVPTTAFVLAAAIPAHAAEPVRTDAKGGLQTSTSVATKDANARAEAAAPVTYELMLAGMGAVAFLALRRRQS